MLSSASPNFRHRVSPLAMSSQREDDSGRPHPERLVVTPMPQTARSGSQRLLAHEWPGTLRPEINTHDGTAVARQNTSPARNDGYVAASGRRLHPAQWGSGPLGLPQTAPAALSIDHDTSLVSTTRPASRSASVPPPPAVQQSAAYAARVRSNAPPGAARPMDFSPSPQVMSVGQPQPLIPATSNIILHPAPATLSRDEIIDAVVLRSRLASLEADLRDRDYRESHLASLLEESRGRCQQLEAEREDIERLLLSVELHRREIEKQHQMYDECAARLEAEQRSRRDAEERLAACTQHESELEQCNAEFRQLDEAQTAEIARLKAFSAAQQCEISDLKAKYEALISQNDGASEQQKSSLEELKELRTEKVQAELLHRELLSFIRDLQEEKNSRLRGGVPPLEGEPPTGLPRVT